MIDTIEMTNQKDIQKMIQLILLILLIIVMKAAVIMIMVMTITVLTIDVITGDTILVLALGYLLVPTGTIHFIMIHFSGIYTILQVIIIGHTGIIQTIGGILTHIMDIITGTTTGRTQNIEEIITLQG